MCCTHAYELYPRSLQPQSQCNHMSPCPCIPTICMYVHAHKAPHALATTSPRFPPLYPPWSSIFSPTLLSQVFFGRKFWHVVFLFGFYFLFFRQEQWRTGGHHPLPPRPYCPLYIDNIWLHIAMVSNTNQSNTIFELQGQYLYGSPTWMLTCEQWD